MKPCGECRVCCKVFPVPVLKKPAGVWCQFNCPAGCEVHGPAMPAVCRQYDCYWRDRELPDDLRPDRLGIVITEAGNLWVGHQFPPVLIMQIVTPDALEKTSARKLLDALVAEGFVAVAVVGNGLSIQFDPLQYKTLAADMIERALKQRFADEAAELKLLGAAGDDYDPLEARSCVD